MKALFNYDEKKHFIKPNKRRLMLVRYWMLLCFLLNAFFLIEKIPNREIDPLLLIISLFFLMATVVGFVTIRNNNFFSKEADKVYLKIEKGHIKSTLKNGDKEEIIPLSEIRRIIMGAREVILKLGEDKEVFINTFRILNPKKKSEFEKVMLQLFPK